MNPVRLLTLTGGLSSETRSLVDAMTVKPTSTRMRRIDRVIRGLKQSGVWDKLDVFYMLAAHDSQAARLNWKTPGTATLAIGGSPTFAADRGFTGDGVGASLSTDYTPSKHLQDDGHVAGFGLTTSVNTANDIAGAVAGGAGRSSVRLRALTAAQGQVMSGSNTAATAGSAAPYFVLANRTISTTQGIYTNGAADGSGAVASMAAVLTKFNILGNPVSGNYADRQVAMAGIGGSLSDAQIAEYYAAVRTYLQGVGAA